MVSTDRVFTFVDFSLFKYTLVGEFQYTEKKYFRQILILVSKTFLGFPSLGVEYCFLFKVKLLVLRNYVLPERYIRDMFYSTQLVLVGFV